MTCFIGRDGDPSGMVSDRSMSGRRPRAQHNSGRTAAVSLGLTRANRVVRSRRAPRQVWIWWSWSAMPIVSPGL